MNCTCMISLLFLLLLTHWTHTFSLHSFLNPTEKSQSSSPLIERLRRWSRYEDHDEVEIPLNETLLSENNADDQTTLNNTLFNYQTIESNSSIITNIDDLINSTYLTTVEVNVDENTTMILPFLRQDLIESNQTIVSIVEDVNEINSSTNLFNETSDFNHTVRIDTVPDEFQSSTLQTTDQVQLTTTLEMNQTNGTDTSLNVSLITATATIITDDEWIIHSNITQKDAQIIQQEIQINETELIPIETNDTSIVSSKSVSIPICDQSCECSRECPYGFEIFNDTCLCNPPCQNYPCYGNDTCIVNDNGQPLCQPVNGTKHDLPTRCYQPRDAGYHDDNIRYYNRWYYHPDQDTCHLFVYRGLGGNENNFQTLHECHLECITCAPLPDPGECLGRINMWYFNRKENQCREFEYSGCKGNENKFVKKEECIDTCVNRIFNL